MSDITPPVSPARRPPLWQIGEYPFQDLTVDLLAREPDLKNARLHGHRGHEQFGVDATAEIVNGRKLAASCKCSEDASITLIRTACREFDTNKERWKKEGIVRFIVVIAGYADHPKVQKEEGKQKARYRKTGIAFELWDGTIIVQKIRVHPDLVYQYLSGDTWLSILCGPQYALPKYVPSTTKEAETERLRDLLAELTRHEIDSLRAALRRGRRSEVGAKLASLRRDSSLWRELTPEVQASVLRLQASLAIEMDKIDDAELLVAEALELYPHQSVVGLQTRIRLEKMGPEEALAALPVGGDDVETLCARGSLLLILARLDEAAVALETAYRYKRDDVDTVRLLALLSIMRNDVARALELANESIRLAGEWEIVRRTRAVILYLSGLSSPRVQGPGSGLPDPVQWAFVRRDDESARRFLEAAEVFRGLAEDLERPARDRQALEIWWLACLANLPTEQATAAQTCATLISKHPCNIYAVPWAIERNYGVDFARAAFIADQSTQSAPTDVHPVLIAVACRLHANDDAGARAILIKDRSIFESQGQIEAWNYWWMILLLASGDADGAVSFARGAGNSPLLERIETAALLQQAYKSHDSERAKNRLSDVFESTGDALYLMLWAQQQAFDGNWVALSERAGELLRVVPTPDALYLVLLADFETRAYCQCLSRMEKSRGLFPASRFSLEVKRLRITCLERWGKPRDALHEAADLRHEDGSTPTLVSFTRLCCGYGDVRTAIAAAEELAERSDLTAEDAISIAELLAAHDAQISRRLLRRATAQQIPAGRILRTLSLGQSLAIDHEQTELRKRLEILVHEEHTPIRALKRSDVLQLVAQTGQVCNEILASYEKGSIPVHTAIDACGFNLAALLPSSHGEQYRPLDQVRFFVFHGRRSDHMPIALPPTVTRLNLDITTVFLVSRLDLWAVIEQAFSEIRCSHAIVPLLHQVLNSMMSIQPKVEDAIAELWELYRSGHVSVAGGDADEMQAEHVSIPAAVEELRLRGLIAESEHARVIQSLPSLGGAGGTTAALGARVLCSRDDLVALATSGALGALCRAFQVCLGAGTIASIEADISSLEEGRAITESIKHVIEELGERFKKGSLHTFPENPESSTVGTLALRALAELNGFPADSQDLICADDRYINRFDYRGDEKGVRIVSLLDLLTVLAERTVIDEQRIWQIRHALRASNCFFVPLGPREIVHHLMNAPTRDGAVVETLELRVMRQYVAVCFCQANVLQRMPLPAEQLGELGFVIGLRRAVVEALTLLWGAKAQSSEARIARANWLIESLYVDHLGIWRVAGITKSPEEERHLEALSAATLMMPTFDFGSRNETNKHVPDYNRWVWNNLFRRRSNGDPTLLEAVANSVTLYFSQVFDQTIPGDDVKDRGLLAAAIFRMVARFPEPLRSRVREGLATIPWIEEGVQRVIKVDDLEFEAVSFMRQVAAAFANGNATAQVLRSREEVTIRRLQGGNWDAIDLERPTHRSVHRWRNRLWGVLLESPSEREMALRRHYGLFDLQQEEFERLLLSVRTSEDPFDRFEATVAAARLSLPFYYDGLEQQVKSNESLMEADLMPDNGAVFFRYYGDEGEFAPDAAALIAEKSTTLSSRVGQIQATVRLASLPVPLPTTIEVAFQTTDPDQQKEFIHSVLRAGPTPVHRIQTLRLACLAAPTPAVQRLRKWLIREHLSRAGRDERTAFLSVLEWTVDAFDNWHAAHRWDRSLRLLFSWLHASHLFAMYRRAHAPLEWITQTFHRPLGYQAITDLEEDFVHGKDVAAPDSGITDAIAVSGLAYALSPDNLPLSRAVAFDAKQQWFSDSSVPHAQFLEIPSGRPNALASFLGRDRLDDLQSLLGPELDGDCGGDWRSELQRQAMAAITGKDRPATGWGLLAALYRDGPAPAEASGQIDGALRSTNFRDVVERDPANAELLILAIANRLPHVACPEARAAITSSLINLAEWYGLNGGTEAQASGLLNLVLAHGYPAIGRPSTLAEFQQLCLGVAAKFPKFAGPCRYAVERFCHDLPVDKGANYWPLVLALRAIDPGG